MTSTTRPRRPALVEPDDVTPARLLGSGLPERTVAVFAAVQGWVLSVLLVVLPTLAAALTAAEPGDQPGWGAGRVGLRLWLLGHGAPQAVGGAVVSLVPLGVTALAVYTLYAATRRSQVSSRAGLVAGAVGYAVLTVATALLAGLDGTGVLRSAVGGLVVGGLGTGLGIGSGARSGPASSTARGSRARPWRNAAAPVSRRLSSPVRAGLRAAVLAGALLTGLSASLVVAWVVAGRATVGAVVRGLSLDTVGGVVYALAQLVYLPNLLVWALAWLSGAGFAVGSGTRFAPDEVVGGPMPAVPLLGALPTWSLPGYLALAAPAALVVVGVLAGVYLHRRAPAGAWWHPLASVGTCALATAVATAVVVAVASGSAGPGRMGVVGATWWQVGPLVGGLVGLGAALVALPGSAVLRRTVASAVRGRG